MRLRISQTGHVRRSVGHVFFYRKKRCYFNKERPEPSLSQIIVHKIIGAATQWLPLQSSFAIRSLQNLMYKELAGYLTDLNGKERLDKLCDFIWFSSKR